MGTKNLGRNVDFLVFELLVMVVVALLPGEYTLGAVQTSLKSVLAREKTKLETCLHNQKEVQSCIYSSIATASRPLTVESCFAEGIKLKSDFLKEETLQYCFYQLSEFATLNSCVNKAQNFKTAINHDEALFECVRQHQTSIAPESCKQIARQMRYPEKSKYLLRQCDSI